jgi:flagellar biosynthesis protein FliR
MKIDAALFYSFLLVFVRCSAMLLSSPMFSAQNTPVRIRILITVAISGALTLAINPSQSSPPADMYSFVAAVANEALAGLLMGAFFSLVLHAASIAGAFLDLQMGLGMSQALNPMTGVPVTIISQFKYFLCLVVFLTVDAHHIMLQAFSQSYTALPVIDGPTLEGMKESFVGLLGRMSLLALQMAAPVAAVSVVVDAAFGIINRAVPQMHAFLVGLPAKTLMGMIALSVALPAMASAVYTGVEMTTEALFQTGRPLPAP